jgi:probable rRNA maturation factor
MTVELDLLNDPGYPVDQQRLYTAVERVLEIEGIKELCAMSIVLTDDETIRDYNRQYRQVDAPTDVLSFPADEPPVSLPDEPRYLGDLLIAYPYSQAQAEREGHPTEDMLALLVIHGTLHLLGHDHDSPENQAVMWAAQAAALQALGIAPHIADF